MNLNSKINICISTHKNYYKKTLPILITSLMKSGCLPEDIYVFCGGNDSFSSQKLKNGSNFFEVDYNSFDYTALIGIVDQDIEEENWFLLHDTCRVGNNFYELLKNNTDFSKDRIALKARPSMSMGFYRKSFLKENKDFLFSLKNKDYSDYGIDRAKGTAMGNEDALSWIYKTECTSYPNQSCITTHPDNNWYITSTNRIQEYYPHLDLYKLKANWGQDYRVTTV